MPDIVAIGGAAFSADPRNLALDKYVLDLTGKARPKALLIPTARGDEPGYVAQFYEAYSALDARPTHLPFFHRTPDLRALVLDQDVVFVRTAHLTRDPKPRIQVHEGIGVPALRVLALRARLPGSVCSTFSLKCGKLLK